MTGPRSRLIALCVLPIIGALMLAWSLSIYGPAMAQTGIHTIAAAESLLAGEPLVTSRNEPFTLWPPLMPVMFAAGAKLGLSYSATAGTLNVFAYFTVLLCSGLLARQLSGSRVAVVLVQLALLSSPALLRSMCTVQTEPVFIALALLGAVAAARFATTNRRRWLALAACAFALASIQRYVGAVLSASTAILLLIGTGAATSSWPRARRAAAFACAALLPLTAWAARNYGRVGYLSGARTEADASYSRNASDALSTLLNWLAPERWPAGGRALLLGCLLLALALWVRARLAASRPPDERWIASYVVLLPTAHVLFLIVYGSNTHLDPLGNRLLLPALPFLFVLLAVAASTCLRGTRPLARGLGTASIAALMVVIATGAGPTREIAAASHAKGLGGLGARQWRESPLVEALMAAPLEGPVYSNLPELVRYYRGVHAEMLPPRALRRTLRASQLMQRPGTIVWVSRNGFPRMRAQGPPVITLRTAVADGAIYETAPP